MAARLLLPFCLGHFVNVEESPSASAVFARKGPIENPPPLKKQFNLGTAENTQR